MTVEPTPDLDHEQTLDRLTDALRAVDTTLSDATRDAVLARLSEEPMPAVVAAPIDPLQPRRRRKLWLGLAAGATAAAALAAVAAIYLPAPPVVERPAPPSRPSLGVPPPRPPADDVVYPHDLVAAVVGAFPTISPMELAKIRAGGRVVVEPDDETKTRIERAGNPVVNASVRLCLGSTGKLIRATLVESTGYPTFDETIMTAVETWRFRPYAVNGTPMRVCSIVRFVYR